jgi:hypothetical protein
MSGWHALWVWLLTIAVGTAALARLPALLGAGDRRTAALARSTVTESLPASFTEAREWTNRIFGQKLGTGRPAIALKGAPPKDVRQLWSSLERTLGARETWRVPVLRELWSTLFAGAGRRRRSADHERIFFQVAGYTLRPGFGYPLDEWRCEQMFRLFPESVQFHKEKGVWVEFWVMWRRLAGGLAESHHEEIWAYLKPHLEQRLATGGAKQSAKPKGVQPEGLDEMVRLAAALEHLAPAEKTELGEWIIRRLRHAATIGGPWTWALGRIGARAPIYGSVHKTVSPEKATEWVTVLLGSSSSNVEGALFAVAQLARLTGDRARDLEDEIRARVLAGFKTANTSPSWRRMITEAVVLEAADKARALGDTLPVGLQIA